MLDEVQCTGTELSLANCSSLGWMKSNCRHDEDAGVICTNGERGRGGVPHPEPQGPPCTPAQELPRRPKPGIPGTVVTSAPHPSTGITHLPVQRFAGGAYFPGGAGKAQFPPPHSNRSPLPYRPPHTHTDRSHSEMLHLTRFSGNEPHSKHRHTSEISQVRFQTTDSEYHGKASHRNF